MIINGKDYKPFVRVFNDEHYSSMIVGRRGASPIPHRGNKVVALDEVLELIKDGDVISYPHYYRTGDKTLERSKS